MAWTEIVDYTWAANETSRTFTGLNITKNDFIKVVSTYVNPIGSFVGWRLLANNSTNTNYYTQELFGNGTNVTAQRGNYNYFNFAAGNTSGSSIAYCKLSENDRFNIFANVNLRNDSLLINDFVYITSSGATFSSGITSLTVQADQTNGIGTGSRIQIYKLTAEKVVDLTVYSNTTQIDLTGFTMDKGSEYLLVSDLIVNGTSAYPQLFVNDNNTATNYYSQVIEASGSSATAARYNFPGILGTESSNRAMSYTHIKLSEIGAMTYQSYSMATYGTSSVRLINWFGSSIAENITSITKISLITGGTDRTGAGTRYQLYKLY